ncbi:MAG: 50S ribosomal protein L3 [Candidatus Nezhaarchaeota archaeon]|nr:50S ribosomal protein L3 [Candidatus Nezhaarchaeota archaeon]MCX8141893.1 50S ribosomal protein L3 [Candidatus Nezhaarchaeota archaeon]MDW8050326.1 50S ribosomal protein L3 [Nitrososphaerota archaeon]
MGRGIHAPRRGSLGFYPRVRALRIEARIRRWPNIKVERPQLLGFAAYKVGMTHAVIIEDRPTSPFYGREMIKAITILEAPPLFVFGARLYASTPYGLKSVCDVLADNYPEDLKRVMILPKNYRKEDAIARAQQLLAKATEVRVLACEQPRLSGLRKKTPEVMEIKVAAKSVGDAWDYALSLLGKEVRATDVFREGQYVDVIAVTKGKGFQGVIKRHGVKILPRWHKHRKGHRKVGCISPQHPEMLYTVPRPGQLGFHQRTEYNKRIIKMGDDGLSITVKGGFVGYGVVRGQYIVLLGSVPGPRGRIIKLRYPIRPPANAPTTAPKVIEINVDSKQGG